MAARSVASPITRASAAASPTGSFGCTSSPVAGSSTISGVPSTAVATTGSPHAMASHTTVGRPSERLGSTNTSPADMTHPTSSCGTLPSQVMRSAMPSSPARASAGPRISPIPAITRAGAPSGRRARIPMASMRSSTPLRGTNLPTYEMVGASGSSPRRSRATRASRGMNTVASAPLGTTVIARRGRAMASAAWPMAWLTVTTASRFSMASATRIRDAAPMAGMSSTSARWAVPTAGTPSPCPTRAAAQPSGTTICAWITSIGHSRWMPCTVLRTPNRKASALRWPRRAPGSVSLRG